MNRLAMIFGMLTAGLMIGVLPPALANATPAADAGNHTHRTVAQPRIGADREISTEAMYDMQRKMAQLAKESAERTAEISGSQPSVSQMAKNVKQ